MGGWRLESAKMLGYLAFPIGAFMWFNHPVFYEYALKQTLENVSKDINLDNIAELQKINSKGGIDKLSKTIDELNTKTPTATTTQTSTKKSL